MSAPIRVQRKRVKGYRLPPNTKSVTRPGPFGNPFHVVDILHAYNGDKVAAAEDCVRSFRTWLGRPEGAALADRVRIELRGFNLACYCPLGSPCHADVLLEIANA